VKKSFSKKSKKKPSPDQALLGAVMAGVIAVILYKFTTNIEDALYRQTISSNNFSVCTYLFFCPFFILSFLISYNSTFFIIYVHFKDHFEVLILIITRFVGFTLQVDSVKVELDLNFKMVS
jgi:hypothetical protein